MFYITYKENKWSKESKLKKNIKGIEIRNLIFRTKKFLSFYNNNSNNQQIEIKLNFILKGESSCWLILRTNDDTLNEFSVVLKIYKENLSQKCFAALGTFIKDIDSNLRFKIFTKVQLIDFSSIYFQFFISIFI